MAEQLVGGLSEREHVTAAVRLFITLILQASTYILCIYALAAVLYL